MGQLAGDTRVVLLLLRVVQDVLSAGQGFVQRVAESGQLVFDRVRHADALEYLWYLTR